MKSIDDSTDARQRKTLRWVVAITAFALIFDGYDLVVYGTVVSTLLRDPSQIGALDPVQAGLLGSYALMGVMVGALAAGAVGDYFGRRKIMLINIVWFSIGMAATAMTTSVTAFGLMRFLTGIGVGALIATAGAMIAEFAPAGRRNFYNALVYSGVPAGALIASLLAMMLSDSIGWRGMFLIGALPIAVLLPIALVKLPESPKWLYSRGRIFEAEVLSARTGIPMLADGVTMAAVPSDHVGQRSGFPGLASKRFLLPTVLLGLMSFSGLLLTYGLNTWLPEIMLQYGYGKNYSLLFLVTLNAGAVIGGLVASRAADRFGPRRIVSSTFGLATLSLILITLHLPLGVLLSAVAVAGVGTLGTQVLIYGFVSNYYTTPVRAAGVAWCAGFGRLGGIFGPLLGGFLIAAGAASQVAFFVFAGVALFGALVTAFVPRHVDAEESTVPEPQLVPAVSASVTLQGNERR
ncbi:aromatic acid/H+ symport family MFS transporter [Cryobacterium sp. TMS1-13-1]|uniref:MFS transporter n=1 Tax=Cryobacterium sp. TMS1-13-1 TaxID=1259220 RepID=UPI001069DECA|nr:aromatic acid/H+ symport family MFS transporter [Cryobacterium sp. TMS1-13-1]TFD23364.1 MFS transporter [Cryobacterium sp. TMS1-13-1]